ncbi:hypothetical protein [Teichococcus wenyumeiae]|uniref:hypothetical protein n=1 Tax=Teichococcus wenyumeiae TaxID=2478470 RepID=UPI003462872F
MWELPDGAPLRDCHWCSRRAATGRHRHRPDPACRTYARQQCRLRCRAFRQLAAEPGLRAQPSALCADAHPGGGRNFGCGSTREHAAWALDGFGVRVLLALSFG